MIIRTHVLSPILLFSYASSSGPAVSVLGISMYVGVDEISHYQ
jgi:hypothetical protein